MHHATDKFTSLYYLNFNFKNIERNNIVILRCIFHQALKIVLRTSWNFTYCIEKLYN